MLQDSTLHYDGHPQPRPYPTPTPTPACLVCDIPVYCEKQDPGFSKYINLNVALSCQSEQYNWLTT